MLDQVSTNGSSNLLIQLGTSSGVTTTGYTGAVAQCGGTNQAGGVSSTAGLLVCQSQASGLIHRGIATFTLIGSNKWVGTSVTTRGSDFAQTGSTVVSLAATLDRVRITTVNGTDAYNAGSINILYE